MNNTIDPTYLRAIREGLLSGKLEKENEAELPEGIAELFEKELFPLNMAITEKQLLIHFFTSFAVAQKEVRPQFIAEILDWEEEKVSIYIYRYSKWFSGSGNNQFCLYHDRFRVYILQKITSKSFSQFNDKLIQICNQAISLSSTAEKESYALECLSTHLYIKAMLEGNCLQLKQFAYDTIIWERQIKASKGFEWSKNMLNEMMMWASKFDEEEVIECALNKVDLYHLEQNDIPSIVQLVADADIETALLRIEAFGGNDKEGFQRKFILYMLCLMELTLLDSKGKDHTKTSIEKILKHFDEQIPEDHSILNWNDFFPSYLMFQMACEWAEMGLEYLWIYKRTTYWENNWIEKKGPYNDLQLIVLKQCTTIFENQEYWISNTKTLISIELAKQGNSKDAMSYAGNIIISSSRALGEISIELAKIGKIDDAVECSKGIHDKHDKSNVLKGISIELAKFGDIDGAIKCSKIIHYEPNKSEALGEISIELAKLGRFGEALENVGNIKIVSSGGVFDYRTKALREISIELARLSRFEEALGCAKDISDNLDKSIALETITSELAKQGEIQAAIACFQGISNKSSKNIALKNISIELAKQGKIEEAIKYARDISRLKDISFELAKQGKINKALECARDISVESDKIIALMEISNELAKQVKIKEAASLIQEALACARSISEESEKSSALKDISKKLAKQGQVKEAATVMEEALTCAVTISKEFEKTWVLMDISKELAKQGKVKEALDCAFIVFNNDLLNFNIGLIEHDLLKFSIDNEIIEYVSTIRDLRYKGLLVERFSAAYAKEQNFNKVFFLNLELTTIYSGLGNDSIELVTKHLSKVISKKNQAKKALFCASKITNAENRLKALIGIANILSEKGQDVNNIIQQAISFTMDIQDSYKKSLLLAKLSSLLEVFNKNFEYEFIIEDAINLTIGIEDYYEDKALMLISKELSSQGKINKALKCINNIGSSDLENEALFWASTGFARTKKTDEALKYANEIDEPFWKCCSFSNISTLLIEQGLHVEGNELLNQAFDCLNEINDEIKQGDALSIISIELTKQDNLPLLNKIVNKIPQIFKRIETCKSIGKTLFETKGYVSAINTLSQFDNPETITYIRKGIIESISIEKLNKNIAMDVFKYPLIEVDDVEKILQYHAIDQLFFFKIPQEKLERYNRTLDIQWAIDIKNQLPN